VPVGSLPLHGVIEYGKGITSSVLFRSALPGAD
jgi:hypothetical protein